MREPAELIHGLVLSVSLTLAHFSSVKASRCKPSPLVKKTKTNCPVFEGEKLRLTARVEGDLHCMRLCDVHKTRYFCSSAEGTGTQLSHCLGKPPFLCTQLAPPSPYQHHEQENTPHLFSVTPSASCHSNPRREVDHINGKQSLHSSNSLCV